MKQFLENNEALSLAATIADVQEKKIQLKMDKVHKLRAAQPQQIPKTASRAKSKLKETKDLLVTRRMQAKRDKVRSRKKRLRGDKEYQQGSIQEKPLSTVQKRVSFL